MGHSKYNNVRYFQSKHHRRCRPVYCPTGQMFDLEGNCVLITNAMSMKDISIVSIQIRLTALGDAEQNMNAFKRLKVTDVGSAIPWPASWRIAFLAIAHVEGNNVTWTREVLMILETFRRNLRSNIDDVKRSLPKRIALSIDGNETLFRQTIYHQIVKRFVDTDKIRTTFVSDYVEMNGLTADLAGVDLTIWEELYMSSTFFNNKIMMSQLYLCPQIKLAPDEFLVMADQRLLYHLESGRYFYAREFHLNQDDNVTTAKICAEEVGYGVNSQSSGSHSCKYFKTLSVLMYRILPTLIVHVIKLSHAL